MIGGGGERAGVGAGRVRRRAPGDDDDETVPALLRAERLCTTWHAREQVRVSRRMRELPAVATAFADGVIGYAHARQIAAAATDARLDAARRDQRDLVDAAAGLDPRGLRLHLARWRHATDPLESLAEEQRDLRAARRFRVQGGFDEVAFLEGELHPRGPRSCGPRSAPRGTGRGRPTTPGSPISGPPTRWSTSPATTWTPPTPR